MQAFLGLLLMAVVLKDSNLATGNMFSHIYGPAIFIDV